MKCNQGYILSISHRKGSSCVTVRKLDQGTCVKFAEVPAGICTAEPSSYTKILSLLLYSFSCYSLQRDLLLQRNMTSSCYKSKTCTGRRSSSMHVEDIMSPKASHR